MALAATEPWHYFHPTDQAAALVALRARMGSQFATSPSDNDLLLVLERAVALVHRATGQFFLLRTGTLDLSGNDSPRIQLPFPVVSTDQGGTGITSVLLFDDTVPVPAIDYIVNDGAWDGDEDPRRDPFIEWNLSRQVGSSPISRPPSVARSSRWPWGVRNVHVAGSWGYLTEAGNTPELILYALVRLCILNAVPVNDSVALDDRRRGALLGESVQGRSYTFAAHAISAGLTLDRELDRILRSYKRPPRVIVSRPPRRRSRAFYSE